MLLEKRQNISIIISGMIGLIIGVGISRFVFTSLLLSMFDDFLTLKDAGFLASINYIGYLCGSILAVFLQSINTKIFFFRLGIIICITSTLALGLSKDMLMWQYLRVIAGFGSACCLVIGSSIVMSKLNFENKTKAMGIHFSGIGFAILLSDLFAKYLLSLHVHWSDIWIYLSLIGFVIAIVPFVVFKKQKFIQKSKKFHFDIKIFTPFAIFLICAYFTQGIGFVVQATFLPDIIDSVASGYGQKTWSLVGFGGIFSCIILMNLAHKFGSINIIILAFFLQIIGILIPTLSSNIFLNLLSGALYGGTFIGLVALFMNLGGEISKSNPLTLMGALTTSYGLGQIIAPLYSVKLFEIYKNYNYTLYLTALIVFGGIIIMQISKKYYKKEQKCL